MCLLISKGWMYFFRPYFYHRHHTQLFSCVQIFATLRTIAHQGPLSIGFFRQEHWSGYPFPFPGDLPNPGIQPGIPALQADSISSEPSGNLLSCICVCICICLCLSISSISSISVSVSNSSVSFSLDFNLFKPFSLSKKKKRIWIYSGLPVCHSWHTPVCIPSLSLSRERCA